MGDKADKKAEIIVSFRRGVAEDAARSIVERHGCTVRRKMRSDHADDVILLVKVAEDRSTAVQGSLTGDRDVLHVEINGGGYKPMD